MQACVVIDSKTGHIQFTNDDAIRWLMAQGKLDWRIEEYGQASIQPPTQPPPRNSTDVYQSDTDLQLTQLWEKKRKDIFQRTKRGNTTPCGCFTRDHRQVFALVDGRRTTEEIVQAIRKPPAVILRLLQDLLSEGFIS